MQGVTEAAVGRMSRYIRSTYSIVFLWGQLIVGEVGPSRFAQLPWLLLLLLLLLAAATAAAAVCLNARDQINTW